MTFSSLSQVALCVVMASVLSCVCTAQTPLPPLYVFYSATHNDNVVVATAASIASLDSSYSYYDGDLQVASNTTQLPNTVPLNFYLNTQTNHHMTTASAAGNAYAKANGFVFQRVEGYVYATQSDSSMMPLEMWYSSQRDDHFLVGTAQNRNNAIGAGYVLQYIDCYAPVNFIVWPNTPPTSGPPIPFPQSQDLLSYEYAYGNNAVPPNIGADTWYPSWDGEYMYSSWTDGTVYGVGSSSAGNGATTGFATVVGTSPWNLTLVNVSVYVESAYPYQGRYPSLNFHHNGIWYYGTYSLDNYQPGISPAPDCGNWCILGPFTDIRYSLDGTGNDWVAPIRNMTSYTDNIFQETSFNNSKVKIGAPHAVDFGNNNQYSPDGALYMISTGAESPDSHESWMQGDSVYLSRSVGGKVPAPADINSMSSWEFYAGTDPSTNVTTWSSNLTAAKPLFVWMQRTGVVTMSWHPTISKYIMVVSTPTNSPSTVENFDTYYLESDSMFGPWSYITYTAQYGPEAYFVHIPSRFMGVSAYAATKENAPRGMAITHVTSATSSAAASSTSSISPSFSSLSASEQAEEISVMMGKNYSTLVRPFTPKEKEEEAEANFLTGASGYYDFFLSYSANFAEGSNPNPPGSGYHWSLQQSRFSLSSRMQAKVEARGGKVLDRAPL